MNTAIEKIFFLEQPHFQNIKQSPKYWEVFDKLCEMIKKLGGEITAEQKQMLNDINDLQTQLCGEVELTAYKVGFKFGLQIGADTFND